MFPSIPRISQVVSELPASFAIWRGKHLLCLFLFSSNSRVTATTLSAEIAHSSWCSRLVKLAATLLWKIPRLTWMVVGVFMSSLPSKAGIIVERPTKLAISIVDGVSSRSLLTVFRVKFIERSAWISVVFLSPFITLAPSGLFVLVVRISWELLNIVSSELSSEFGTLFILGNLLNLRRSRGCSRNVFVVQRDFLWHPVA